MFCVVLFQCSFLTFRSLGSNFQTESQPNLPSVPSIVQLVQIFLPLRFVGFCCCSLPINKKSWPSVSGSCQHLKSPAPSSGLAQRSPSLCFLPTQATQAGCAPGYPQPLHPHISRSMFEPTWLQTAHSFALWHDPRLPGSSWLADTPY